MNTRFLVVGTIVGGLVIFLWGTVSHVLLPVSESTLHEFTDAKAVVAAVQANAPRNGVYMAPQGVFVAVALRPDLAEKTIAPSNLVTQLVIELATAFFLCLLLLRMRPRSAWSLAGATAIAAIAAGIEQIGPEWNWYGFSASFACFEFLDLVIGWFLAGLVLAALMKKLAPART